PVTNAGSRPNEVTCGAVVSRVIVSGAEAALTLPTESVAVAVNAYVPSPSRPRSTPRSTGPLATPLAACTPLRYRVTMVSAAAVVWMVRTVWLNVPPVSVLPPGRSTTGVDGAAGGVVLMVNGTW